MSIAHLRRSWRDPEIWTVIDRATRTPIVSTRELSFAVEFCEQDRANREIKLANPLRRPATWNEGGADAMKNGRPQAKDLDDLEVLRAIHRLSYDLTGTNWATTPRWVFTWDLEPLFQVPEKVLLAKLDALIKRNLLDGCTCGCRGDFVLQPAGVELLGLTN